MVMNHFHDFTLYSGYRFNSWLAYTTALDCSPAVILGPPVEDPLLKIGVPDARLDQLTLQQRHNFLQYGTVVHSN